MAMKEEYVERIREVARGYGATRLILFGSSLEHPDEARDIDLACDGVTGWRLYELAARLEEELHTPLDVFPLPPRLALPA